MAILYTLCDLTCVGVSVLLYLFVSVQCKTLEDRLLNFPSTIKSFFKLHHHTESGTSSSPVSSFFSSDVPPAALMSTPELIRYHGYPVEEIKVTTQDGYILTVFRIPHGKNTNVTTKEPCLLWNGFLSSSNDWLLVPNPEDNLPYLLVNDGHEVWLANQRGTNFSLDHVNLRSDSPEFFNFSWDEMGKYDVTSVIATILKTTHAKHINYVGHSLGCALACIAINEYPQLNNIIRKMTFLAPGIHIEHYQRLWVQILKFVPGNFMQLIMNWAAGGRVIPEKLNSLINSVGAKACRGSIGTEFCNTIIFLISGFDHDQMTNITASLIAGHTPNGASIKTVIQGFQIYKKKKLQKFDYGTFQNLGKYGSSTPPEYKLSLVNVPVQGFYSMNDALILPEDALLTFSELGNVVDVIRVENDQFNHLDFMYAKDAKFYVYDRVVQFMSR